MLEEGRITQTTANLLMQSVDEAIDLVSQEPLSDWKGLKDNVHFPNYYKFLRTSIFPQKLVTSFTVERLELACYICAAFLRAHRIARLQLHEFIGKNLPQVFLEIFYYRQCFYKLLLIFFFLFQLPLLVLTLLNNIPLAFFFVFLVLLVMCLAI